MPEVPPAYVMPEDDLRTSSRCQWFRFASLVLFVVSLFLPGVTTEPRDADFEWGGGLLLLGVFGVMGGVPAWLANPTLAFVWMLMGTHQSRRIAMALSLVSFAFATSFLVQSEMPEASALGNMCRIAGYGAAYWVWLCSILAAMIGLAWEIFSPPADMTQSNDAANHLRSVTSSNVE